MEPYAAGAKVQTDDSVMVVQRTKILQQLHPLSVPVALRLTSRQVVTIHAPFSTTAPSSAGVQIPGANWVTVPPLLALHRHRRFHSDGPQSPLKQACFSPALCLTTGRSRVGVRTTKVNWAEATRTPQAISPKEHQDSRFQCREAVMLSPWTSATTWCVVCWTMVASPAGRSMEADKPHRSGTSSVAQILQKMSPPADILLAV